MRQCGPHKPWTADEPPEAASNDTSAGEGPDFANSSRFHSAPFQRQPVNNSTGPRFHACLAVAWRRRVHSVPPSQIAEDRLPRHRARESLRPHRAPKPVRPLPLRASRWPYACPPPARRRPPPHPAARSRNNAAPRRVKGQQLCRQSRCSTARKTSLTFLPSGTRNTS